MEETLKQMVGGIVTVILQFRGSISLSVCGKLETALGRYHIPGNPAVIFELGDVLSVDRDHSIIRLTE